MSKYFNKKTLRLKSKQGNFDFLGLFLPFFLLILWFFITTENGIPAYLLPSPGHFLRIFLDFTLGWGKITPYSGQFYIHAGASIIRVIIGFSLASFFGLTLGLFCGRNDKAKRICEPFIHTLRAIPGIGWLPLSMVWFGVGEGNSIFLITLASFFPIYVNTTTGAAQISPLILRAGHMLGAKGGKFFTTIILPAAFPSILIGLRLGLGIAWAYLVLGEITGVSQGLGAVMMDARMLGNTEMILSSMLAIAILGRISDLLLVKICNIFYPYQARQEQENS